MLRGVGIVVWTVLVVVLMPSTVWASTTAPGDDAAVTTSPPPVSTDEPTPTGPVVVQLDGVQYDELLEAVRDNAPVTGAPVVSEPEPADEEAVEFRRQVVLGLGAVTFASFAGLISGWGWGRRG